MNGELVRSEQARKTTFICFIINTGLVIIKIIAGIIGNSGAMIADGVHSLSDFLTDIVVLVGFKLSEKPEDDCHNYGHGKYETLATLIISLFLLLVGFEILKSGVSNIIAFYRGQVIPTPRTIALIAAILSIVTKEFLYRYTVLVGKRINSSAMIANAWHHRTDAFSSLGTMLGIGGAIILGDKWTVLDPIASLIVSFFIFKVAFDILKPTIDELMESALTDEEKEKIVKIISGKEEIISFHDLRTRKIGKRVVMEVHIYVDSCLDIKTAHDIATDIEIKIKDIFGESCIVTIHVDPF